MLRRGFVDSFSESFYGLGLSRSFHGFGVCAVDYGQFVPLLFKFFIWGFSVLGRVRAMIFGVRDPQLLAPPSF